MNYKRIYCQFIADRRGREASLTGYTENHHILPRSLGGSDATDNLIRLTAEDHYFAHCCLAKIYGGKMWSALWAVAAMAKTSRAVEAFGRRRMVAAARLHGARRRSDNMRELWASGEFKRDRVYRPWTAEERAARSRMQMGRKSSPEAIAKQRATVLARAKRFEFIHSDGRRFHGAAAEFVAAHGLSQSLVSCLCRGKIKAAKGWRLSTTRPEDIGNHDKTIRRFRHRDGRVWSGNARDFYSLHGLDSGSVSKLLSGKLKSVGGWRPIGPTGSSGLSKNTVSSPRESLSGNR